MCFQEQPVRIVTCAFLTARTARYNLHLKQHVKELCLKHGFSDATFYKWRSKYGGMEVSDARRLKTLESENAKLKKMLAEQMMDVAALKEMLGKNF